MGGLEEPPKGAQGQERGTPLGRGHPADPTRCRGAAGMGAEHPAPVLSHAAPPDRGAVPMHLALPLPCSQPPRVVSAPLLLAAACPQDAGCPAPVPCGSARSRRRMWGIQQPPVIVFFPLSAAQKVQQGAGSCPPGTRPPGMLCHRSQTLGTRDPAPCRGARNGTEPLLGGDFFWSWLCPQGWGSSWVTAPLFQAWGQPVWDGTKHCLCLGTRKLDQTRCPRTPAGRATPWSPHSGHRRLASDSGPDPACRDPAGWQGRGYRHGPRRLHVPPRCLILPPAWPRGQPLAPPAQQRPASPRQPRRSAPLLAKSLGEQPARKVLLLGKGFAWVCFVPVWR